MVAGDEFVPDRGDIVWISPNPQAGHVQAGGRPAAVLSPAAYNGKVGLAILGPVTSLAKGHPFEVSIPAGLRVQGVILADQVKSLDRRARRADLAFQLPETTVHVVLQELGVLLQP